MVVRNNFNAYIDDFKTNTGLEASANIPLYTAYVQARLTDINHQLLEAIRQGISRLPQETANELSRVLKQS